MANPFHFIRHRCAIVGFGAIAERAHLEALSHCRVDVVAVVEIQPERRAAAARLLPGVALYDSLSALLDEQKVDMVDICTPPHLHYENIVQAARAGLHVLCEKPLVLTSAHGIALEQLAEETGVVIACVNNWTYAPILRTTRAWIEAGLIGALRSVEFSTLRTQPAASSGANDNWRTDPTRAGGGILFDHGWHGMSILLQQIQAQPEQVRGSVSQSASLGLLVEDTSETHVDFAGGTLGVFRATWMGEMRRNEATVRGTHGEVRLCNDTLEGWQGQNRVACKKFTESLADGGYRPGWIVGVLRDFLAEIAGDKPRGSMLQQALTSLHLVMATYASAQAGGVAVQVHRLHGNELHAAGSADLGKIQSA